MLSETFFETLHFCTFEEVLMEWMEQDLFSLKYLSCSIEMDFCTLRICWIGWNLVNIAEAHEHDLSYMVLLSYDIVLIMYKAILLLLIVLCVKVWNTVSIVALVWCWLWIYSEYMNYLYAIYLSQSFWLTIYPKQLLLNDFIS